MPHAFTTKLSLLLLLSLLFLLLFDENNFVFNAVSVQRCKEPPVIKNAHRLGSSEDYILGACELACQVATHWKKECDKHVEAPAHSLFVRATSLPAWCDECTEELRTTNVLFTFSRLIDVDRKSTPYYFKTAATL